MKDLAINLELPNGLRSALLQILPGRREPNGLIVQLDCAEICLGVVENLLHQTMKAFQSGQFGEVEHFHHFIRFAIAGGQRNPKSRGFRVGNLMCFLCKKVHNASLVKWVSILPQTEKDANERATAAFKKGAAA